MENFYEEDLTYSFNPNSTQKKDNILTVSQLTNLIRTMLEGSFANIELKGEISNFKPSVSGHLYFNLKDTEAQIQAVMFRGSASSLNFMPKDGMLVQVRGKITVYPPRGNYQIQIISMIQAGTGNIMEMIEMRKQKLAAEGLFNSDRKKRLPAFPKTVGVVTSSTGAALKDIINTRNRRNHKVNLIIFPATVQGDTASESIVRQIKTANHFKMCDILIVGRGGGSLEDLLPFSEENVVQAVAESEIPIISAVGHEIDWALCDFAADVRAPTPTAAAEIAIPELLRIQTMIEDFKQNIYTSIQNRTNSLKLMLNNFKPENMEVYFRTVERKLSDRYDDAYKNLCDGMQEQINSTRHKIELFTQTLENCNPQTILDRGYSMVCDSDGCVIRDAKKIKSGTKISVRPSKGIFNATVD